jgi:hypothetical protein
MTSLLFILITCGVSTGQVITVKQDGTGDFTAIQDAVDITDNGDTVLVYPGTYYENIDVTDKAIVLASTWLLTQSDSTIKQTIIDGNETGSCIRSLSGSYWTEIIGFTLQHGNGTNVISTHPEFYGNGGGIFMDDSKVNVRSCIIVNNFGWNGGGICAWSSMLSLYNNDIYNNWAVSHGGGIRTGATDVYFDSIQLNNVYLNYSAAGSDIAISYNDNVTKIWLDSGTVEDPDRYYIGKFSDWAIHMDRPPISVLHGKIGQVNADLYVDPSGDDENSGLSANEPLKTISFALLKIASDSISPKTVHVADGVYSNSLTGEHTPLQLKNYVNLIGHSRETSIIDCENKYEGARFAFGQEFTYIKKISLINGNGYPTSHNGGISTGYSKKIVMDSIAMVNTTGDFAVGLYSCSNDTLIIRNSLFKDCKGYKITLPINHYDQEPCYMEFVSNQYSNNHPDSSHNSRQNSLAIGGSEFVPDLVKARIINCLFNENVNSLLWAQYPGPIALSAYGNCNLDVVNCTFANNTTTNPWGGAVGASYSSDINFYNCILYGNDPFQVYLVNNTPDQADTVRVYHSLVQDGMNGIINYGVFNQVIWGEGNIDADPLFLGSEEYPYALDYGSPCIDAGTLNLPPGIELPEYDIAGNPRVWGESVDMGAYEYGPWVRVPSAPGSKFKVQGSTRISVSPNPFEYGTYISYELHEEGRVNISAYSLSGKKVRSLINSSGAAGEKGKFYWDGCDQVGNSLPAGTYVIRMTVEDRLVEAVKVLIYK